MFYKHEIKLMYFPEQVSISHTTRHQTWHYIWLTLLNSVLNGSKKLIVVICGNKEDSISTRARDLWLGARGVQIQRWFIKSETRGDLWSQRPEVISKVRGDLWSQTPWFSSPVWVKFIRTNHSFSIFQKPHTESPKYPEQICFLFKLNVSCLSLRVDAQQVCWGRKGTLGFWITYFYFTRCLFNSLSTLFVSWAIFYSLTFCLLVRRYYLKGNDWNFNFQQTRGYTHLHVIVEEYESEGCKSEVRIYGDEGQYFQTQVNSLHLFITSSILLWQIQCDAMYLYIVIKSW